MLSDAMKTLRKARSLTQAELGAALGVVPSAVAMWEAGKREPDFEMLVRIAEFFGVTTDALLKGPSHERSDVDFALWGEVGELSDAQKQDVLEYIRFKKLARK